MTGFFILSGCVLDGLILACLQNRISKRSIHTMSDNALYEALVFGTGAVVLALAGGFKACDPATVRLGLELGILIIVEGVFSINAFRVGSMSLSTMVSMCSLVIPIIPAKWLWGEEFTPQRIAGIVLMIISMGLILNLITEYRAKKAAAARSGALSPVENKASAASAYGISREWIFFVGMAFLAGGVMGFNQKKLTTCGLAGETMQYLFCGFLTASVLGALLCLFYSRRKGEGLTFRFTKENTALTLTAGAAMALLHILTMKAIELLPMSVLLPVSSGGRLILVTVLDVWLFRQKLSAEQLAGIAVGTVSIILLSL